MNRSPKLDNELTTSSSPAATAKDSSERMLRIPETPDPSRLVNLVEQMVLLMPLNQVIMMRLKRLMRLRV